MAAVSDVVIRPLAEADAAAAAAVAATGFPRPWTADTLRTEVRAADRDYLGAWSPNGRLIGFAGAWDAPDVTHVMTVVVVPEHRRLGVGRRLVQDLLARAAARGRTTVTLEVRADDPAARALYAGLGFVEIGVRPGYYRDADALLMTRSVPVPVA